MSVAFNGGNSWEAYYARGGAPHIISATNPITVALWMRVAAWGSGSNWSNPLCLLNEDNGYSTRVLFELEHNNSNYLYGYVYTTSSAWVELGRCTRSPSLDKWHHLCIGINADGRHYVVMDGDFANTTVQNTSEVFNGATTVWFGQLGNNSNYFNGEIAHAAIWNAYLSKDEVVRLARGANPKSVRRNLLKHYWPMTHGGIQGGIDRVGQMHVISPYGDPAPSRGSGRDPVRPFSADPSQPFGLPDTSRSFNGTSQYLSRSIFSPLSTDTWTVSCWFYLSSLTLTNWAAIFSVGRSDSASHVEEIEVDPDADDGTIAWWAYDGVANRTFSPTNKAVVGWNHVLAIKTSGSSRRIVLNGDWTNSGTDAVSCNPASLNNFTVGGWVNPGASVDYYPGRLARVAVWSSALTQNDVERLATGVMPDKVDAANLVAYWPLKGLSSPEPDDKNNYDLTLTASPALNVSHPKFSSRDFNGSTQRAQATSVPITAFPFAICGWFREDTTGYRTLVELLHTSGYDNPGGLVGCSVRYNSSAKLISWQFGGTNSSNWENVETTNEMTQGEWQHFAIIQTNSTTRRIVLNGDWANSGYSTALTALAFSTWSFNLNVAAFYDTAWGYFFDGMLAHVAVWDVALTQQQVEDLASGKNPLDVASGDLVSYWPLTGQTSPERDVVGSYDLTLTGTPPQGSTGPNVLAPTGTLSFTLTVPDLAHAHGIDAFALTSAHALVLADSLLAHSADALELTTGGSFFGAVNETSPNDSNYVWSVTPGSYIEFGLSSVTDPGVDTGHVIRYRAQRTTAQASVKISVYQNTTLIEEWTDSLNAALTTFSHTVAPANAANITNYAQLRVRLTALAV